jgi:putative acetyltransferase
MIRSARKSDHAAIAEVVEASYGRADEAELVAALRAGGDAMFELVAEAEGVLVGHILFSRLYADREELIAALAPVAVRPDRQGTGVGSALVRRGLESAKEFGAWGVLVLGEPAYYGRFGFTALAAAQVAAPYAGHPAFQALALEDGVFDRPVLVAYPEAFSGG